jgi:hypothetical protein
MAVRTANIVAARGMFDVSSGFMLGILGLGGGRGQAVDFMSQVADFVPEAFKYMANAL